MAPLLPIFSTRYSQAIMPAWTLLVSTVTSAPAVREFGRYDRNAGLVGAVDRRLDVVRVAGGQHDQVFAGGDEGVDLGVLRGRVPIVLDCCDLDVGVDFPGFKFDALGDAGKERVFQVANRDANGLQVLGGSADAKEQSDARGENEAPRPTACAHVVAHFFLLVRLVSPLLLKLARSARGRH